tara:strand:- start:84 stop:599 length:516 start_codon:yes stop_codon:yes gene_type:complete
MTKEEDINLTPIKMLQVSLLPMPGDSNSWRAHFQYGTRGMKEDGAYVSRSTLLEDREAVLITKTFTNHTRSLRPGSASIYFSLNKPGYMEAEDPVLIHNCIDRQTLVSYIRGTINHLWPEEQSFQEKVEEELKSEARDVAKEMEEINPGSTLNTILDDLLNEGQKKKETFH